MKRRRKAWSLADVPVDVPARETWRADWQDIGLLLVQVFNDCLTRTEAHRRALTEERWSHVKTPTKSAREVFFALHLWCTAQSIEPRAWITSCFAAAAWKSPPSMRTLFSKKMIKTYVQWRDVNLDQVTDFTIAKEARSGKRFVPFVDVYWGAELAKWNMLSRGKADLCMVSEEVTFGFHPKSSVCSSCPKKGPCAERTAGLRVTP